MSFVEYCEILWRAMELGLVFFTMIWPDELYNVELLPLVRPTVDGSLLSGYKSNRINWLEIEGCGSLESMS